MKRPVSSQILRAVLVRFFDCGGKFRQRAGKAAAIDAHAQPRIETETVRTEGRVPARHPGPDQVRHGVHVVADGDDGALRAGKLRLNPGGGVFPERVVEPGLVVGETSLDRKSVV